MDSTLTLFGSIVIGAIFFLGLVTFFGDVTEYSNTKTFELVTQETTASLMEIIDHDFRRLGSGLTSPAYAISDKVGSSDITFLGDVDEDGVVETVRYYLSVVDSASSTVNPNDVILYREIDGTNTIDSPAGVTSFTVTTMDEFGAETSDLMAVRMLHVALAVESVQPYDTLYAKAFWEKRFTPRNLLKRTLTDF